MMLRVNHPHAPARYIDLGPAPWTPLKGTSRLRGHLCVPGPSTPYRSEDPKATARVQAFRKRHAGRKAA
jgi:hypothetical protein